MTNKELAIKIAEVMDSITTTQDFAIAAITAYDLLEKGEYKLILEQVLISMEQSEYYFESIMESYISVIKELLKHLQNEGHVH